MNLRTFFSTALALCVPGAGAVACSSSSSGGGTSPVDACRHYYEAAKSYDQRCSADSYSLPTSEDRFVLECQTLLGAPGAAGAATAIDQCASAQAAQTACGDTPAACETTPTGTLAAGAPCGLDLQCKSGWCKGGGLSTSGGSSGITSTATCGVCADTIPVGQPCDSVGLTQRCAVGATCSSAGATDGGTGGRVCAIVPKSDVGGPCGSGATCKSGLTCDFGTFTCKVPGGAGAACQYGLDCQAPLVCVSGKCDTGKPAGATCSGEDCAQPLRCDLTSMTCKAVTLADAGQPCDGIVTRCRVGSCGSATKKCPAVIADGQPCVAPMSDTTCDDGAYCLGGTCKIYDPSVCK